MEGLGLDPTTMIIMTLFVTGFVQMVRYLVNCEWGKAVTILIAGISGGIAGLVLGIGVLIGVCAGFSASGLITVVKRVGDY